MLVTPESNRHNQRAALLLAGLVMLAISAFGYFQPWLLLALPLGLFVHWLVRRRTRRRLRIMQQSFPPAWDAILHRLVAYFNALNDASKDRFRQMVMVFLDEVRITGIRTEVDDQCRVLIAASAVIPVFGFPAWEYSRLGEVLVYPSAFGSDYRPEDMGTDNQTDRNILGMVGTGHLNGVMVLSKPDLIAGFANPQDKQNVGIHEFAHLVDKADGVIDGIPPGVPPEVVRPWITWVHKEIAHPPDHRTDINPYAYANEAEYFAVLSEYLFEAPEVLARKNPALYDMLEKMYRQDTKSFLTTAILSRPRRVGRNAPCPCGSGKKYKRCCRLKALQGISA